MPLLHSLKSGVSTPLEHSLNRIWCQKWAQTPFQTKRFCRDFKDNSFDACNWWSSTSIQRKKKYLLSVDIPGEPWNLWIQLRQKQHIFDSNYKVFMRIIARGKEVQTSVCQMMIQRPWESMTSIHNSGKTCWLTIIMLIIQETKSTYIIPGS